MNSAIENLTFCSLSTTRVTGKPPGHHFWGVTEIAYIARDRSGNMGKCSFSVIVKGNTNALFGAFSVRKQYREFMQSVFLFFVLFRRQFYVNADVYLMVNTEG